MVLNRKARRERAVSYSRRQSVDVDTRQREFEAGIRHRNEGAGEKKSNMIGLVRLLRSTCDLSLVGHPRDHGNKSINSLVRFQMIIPSSVQPRTRSKAVALQGAIRESLSTEQTSQIDEIVSDNQALIPQAPGCLRMTPDTCSCYPLEGRWWR